MICICGYNYPKAALESRDAYESYALIDDKQYQKFLRAEMKAVESKQLSDIAKASRFVGDLKVCPDCGVIGISWPDSETEVAQVQFLWH